MLASLQHYLEGGFATLTFIEGVEYLTKYIIRGEEIEHRHTGANLDSIDIAKDGQCGLILMPKQCFGNLSDSCTEYRMFQIALHLVAVSYSIVMSPATAP